jgi:hypothetical protein
VGDLTVRDTRFANNYSGWCLPGPSAIQFLGQGTGSLVVEGCLFEDNDGQGVWVADGHLEFRDNVVRRNRFGLVLDGSTLSAVVEHNLFTEQTQESIQVCDGALGVVIRGNTFARNADRGLGPYIATGTVIEENVFTGHLVGLHLCSTCTGITVRCNDSWGNRGLNWMGFPDPVGVDGNISEPPKYCDSPGGDFTVAANSPLLPANNSCGVQIGAFGAGCGPLSVTPASWGKIKAGYRE